MSSLEERRANRLRFMHRLYELTQGNRDKPVMPAAMAIDLALPEDEIDVTVQYLEGEGLVEQFTYAYIRITHAGVRQIEEALSNPQVATEYFPPAINVIVAESISGTTIQQGTAASTQVVVAPAESLASLRDFIAALDARAASLKLSDDQATELRSEMATLRAQLDSTRPKASIMREALLSIRSILESAAGSGVAYLLPQVPALLALLQK